MFEPGLLVPNEVTVGICTISTGPVLPAASAHALRSRLVVIASRCAISSIMTCVLVILGASGCET